MKNKSNSHLTIPKYLKWLFRGKPESDRYAKLPIPVIKHPFTTNYKLIEKRIYDHLNEALDEAQTNNSFPRHYFFTKNIVDQVNTTISRLESKNSQACPFTSEVKTQYEEAFRIGGREQGEDLFIEELLPEIKQKHLDRRKHLDGRKNDSHPVYPFPKFIEADPAEVINVVLAIKALHHVFDNKDRLGLTVEVEKEGGFSKTDYENYYGIDVSKGLSKMQLFRAVKRNFRGHFTSDKLHGFKKFVKRKEPGLWPKDGPLSKETCLRIIDLVVEEYN